MSFSIDVRIEAGFSEAEKAFVLNPSAATFLNLFPSTIDVNFNGDKDSQITPLLLFYSELVRSVTESLLLGLAANLYINSTPVAWIDFDGVKFLIKYYRGGFGQTISVEMADMLHQVGKISDMVRERLGKTPQKKAYLQYLESNRSFETDIIYSLVKAQTD